MAHQTIIFHMFQHIEKVEHEEALQHEPRELNMKNKKTSL